MTWQERAACHGMDFDESARIFFPSRGLGSGAYIEALTYCSRCPVSDSCLAEALTAEATVSKATRHGMFGGLTPRERWRLRADRRCVICGVTYPPSRKALVCSDRCDKIRKARLKVAWVQSKRGRVPRSGEHGTNERVKTGCKCCSCSGHRRHLQREARMRRDAAEAAA